MIVYIGKTKTDSLQRVVEANKGNGSVVMIYLVLMQRAGLHGQCWPSLAKIALDSGFDRRTVTRSLKVLIDQGFIARYEGRSRGYRSSVTRIIL